MNVNTIYVCGMLLSALMTLLMCFVYLNLRTHDGFRSWTLSIACMPVSLICLWLHAAWPEVGLILLSNVLQIASACLAFHGTSRFLGHAVNPWLVWAPLTGGALANVILTLGVDQRALRILAVTVAAAIPLIAQMRLAHRKASADSSLRVTLRLLILFNAIFLVWVAGRAGFFVVAPEVPRQAATDLFQELTYLVVCGTYVGNFFSYLALSFARTLAERKAAEGSMLETRNLLQQVFESSPNLIYVVDASGQIILRNGAATRFHGPQAERSVDSGTGDASAEAAAHRDEQRVIEERVTLVKDELVVSRSNGESRWFHIVKAPLVRANGTVEALVVGTDISDYKCSEERLRASEARFRRIMESDVLGMFFARDSGEISLANDVFLRLLGYSVADVQAGRLNWRQLTPPGYEAADQKALEEMAVTGNCTPYEKEYVRRDGQRVPILLGAATFADQPEAGVAFVLDLSDRKRAEEALRASEERFRDLVETTDAIVWEADATTFSVNSVSANVERLLGYPAADWLQPGFWADHVHPADRARAVDFCVSSTRRMEDHGFDYRFLTKDGRTVWLHDEVKVIVEDGKPRWLRGLMVDITERKRAEAELQQMRFSVDHAGDSIFWISRTGRVLYANEAAWKTRGYTREEILALNVFDLDPDYQPGVWGPHFEETKRLGTITLETQHRTKDGRIFPIEVNANYVSRDGEEFLFATVRDITQRKVLEQERLQSLSLMSSTLESTTDGILVISKSGTIEIYNQKFVRMWGIPAELLATKDDERVVGHILDQIREPELFKARVAYLQEHPEEESFDVIRFKDGRVFERYSRPQWVGDQVVGRALSFRDTTARRQAEAERAKLEAQLHHSQKLEAVGTLAGGIAHDFNNILSGIYGYLNLAQSAAAHDAEMQGYLEEIRRAGLRAADLVRQILAFSRTQGSGQGKTSLALDRVVSEAASLLRAASPPVIEIVTLVKPNPPAVCGNASQLHQVIMNLGTNALHAMHEGPGRLTIQLEACHIDQDRARTLPGLASGPCLRLAVEDTGGGMDAATQERVFEPFFTTKAPGEGTGLGLSVVHGIVADHHGAIRLSSEVGRGTLFEIFLPAEAASVAAPAPSAPALQRGGGERILMVDDETAITLTGKRALEKLGYRVETENSARQALERVERDTLGFQLVLTDQSMPDMTGLELAARLRQRHPDLPIVLASGNSVALTPERTESAGVCEVLSKPYTVSGLVEVVRRHLARKTEPRT